MSNVTVRIPTPLRAFVGGADEVAVSADTVAGVLVVLGERHRGLIERVCDANGKPRPFVNLYLGPKNIKALSGLETALTDGDVLSIVPAVAGADMSGASGKDKRLAELRARIPEIEPTDAVALQARGAHLIDVREADEIAQGSPPGALRLGRGFLELRVEDAVKDKDATVLVTCAGGVRSLFAAEALTQLGYTDVRSIKGGFNKWKNAGLPIEVPRTLTAEQRERYGRHLLMPEVGEKGQLRLLDSKVLLVGAGGLGSPVALYLAAAGVGTIGLIDFDVVDRSNLQRQIVHTDERVGTPKVESARKTLLALNPSIKVNIHETRLDSSNVEQIFAGYEVVVDGSDNFATRYLVNDACVKLRVPNVHGSIFRFEGQVSVFWPNYPKRRGPCYRCVYPEPPPPELAPSCAEAGVLGVLPGVVGLLEAVETVKVLLGIGDPLVGRLVHYDALPARFTELSLDPDPDCKYCREGAEFPGFVDYETFCTNPGVAP